MHHRTFVLLVIFMLIQSVQSQICQNFGSSLQCRLCQGSGNTISQCFYQGKSITNSKQCYDQCCGFVKNSSNENFINRCNALVNESSSPPDYFSYIGLLITGILVTICVLFVLANLIYVIYRIKFREQQQAVNPNDSVPQSGEGLVIQEILSKDLPDLHDNKNDLKAFILSRSQKCSICLQSETEIMTNCCHYFHIDCFGRWIDKNSKCPLCNGMENKFNPVIIYCKTCKYRVLGVKTGRNKGNNYQQLKKYKETLCEACKQQ